MNVLKRDKFVNIELASDMMKGGNIQNRCGCAGPGDIIIPFPEPESVSAPTSTSSTSSSALKTKRVGMSELKPITLKDVLVAYCGCDRADDLNNFISGGGKATDTNKKAIVNTGTVDESNVNDHLYPDTNDTPFSDTNDTESEKDSDVAKNSKNHKSETDKQENLKGGSKKKIARDPFSLFVGKSMIEIMYITNRMNYKNISQIKY